MRSRKVSSELTKTFIEVAGDAERAADVINAAMGTHHHRRKVIEWRNGVVAVPVKTAELMRWHVIHAVLDEDVAVQLCPMLDIHQPGEAP